MTGRVVGLDLSLTSSGIAMVASDGHIRTVRVQPKSRGHQRLDVISREVTDAVIDADLVVVETPINYGVGSAPLLLAGLGEVIRHGVLWALRLPYADVRPSSLKQFATGKGGGPAAGKDAVLAAAVRRFPHVDVNGNDEADALWLAAMGRHHLGLPIVDVPQAHLAALVKVPWPDLAVTAGQLPG